jgi:nudix-type nucleoside diphosphatase (YffH/AdpP family)
MKRKQPAVTIVKKEVVFDKNLVIEELQLKTGNKKFTKQRLKRQDAAVVLLLNTDSDKIVLVKQFRYAIASKTREHIMEIVAGKVDVGEKPIDAAMREVKEETGYKMKKKNIKLMLECFSSPGYSSERFLIYYATVTNADKVSNGGGLKKENEYVNIVEMKRKKFFRKIRKTQFKDAKTYIAGLFALQNLR